MILDCGEEEGKCAAIDGGSGVRPQGDERLGLLDASPPRSTCAQRGLRSLPGEELATNSRSKSVSANQFIKTLEKVDVESDIEKTPGTSACCSGASPDVKLNRTSVKHPTAAIRR